MDDPGEIIDLERQGSKHLSCTQLRQRLEEEMDDETTATANIKRNLDQKCVIDHIFDIQRVYCSVSSCNQIFAKECSNIRYIIMRKKHESFETQDSFHRFMYLVYSNYMSGIQ